MTDIDLAEEALELWLGESERAPLFADGRPTDRALQLYADDMLDPDEAAAVAASLHDPVETQRLARIIAVRDSRKAAILRDRTRDQSTVAAIVSVSARADAMRHVARSHELSVAASSAVRGVVQTTDADELVTLRVAEVFAPNADAGELEVEVRTFDDPRLENARGLLQVATGGTTLCEYELALRDHSFEGRFAIRRLPHPGSAVEFRLYLHPALE